MKRVLVIKLSALGDVIQTLGPMAAIRGHHRNAHITILTTGPYGELLTMAGYGDDVWLDERPGWYQFAKCRNLQKRLRKGQFDRVYDLQTSNRSSAYYRLLHGYDEPLWSGIARGCSHPHRNMQRDAMHTIDRQAEQLRDAGIAETPFPVLNWIQADTGRFGLDRPYVLLVPGGTPHRPGKRWPAPHYVALAHALVAREIQPVLLGTTAEKDILDQIAETCTQARNLCGETTITEIAAVGREALAAVGNDTGPMHVLAISGVPSVVLYSHESNPTLCGQRGPAVEIMRRKKIADVSVEDIIAAITRVAPDLPRTTSASTA